jgi:WD40 repeat protein
MISKILKIILLISIFFILASCIHFEPMSQTASGPPDFSKSEVLYQGPVNGFALNANESSLALAMDDSVKIISMSSGRTSFTGYYSGVPLEGIGLDAPKKTLVGGAGQSIYFWNTGHDQGEASRLNYTSLSNKSAGGPPSDFAMSLNGRYAATASRATFGVARFVLWDIHRRAYKHSFTRISESTRGLKLYGANAVAFSPDGKKMAVALTPENIIEVFRVPDGHVLQHFNLAPGTVRISSMVFSPDGKHIAAVGVGQNGPRNYYPQPIQLWYLSNGAEYQTLRNDSFSAALAFTPNGKYLASGSDNGLIHLWDIQKGRKLQTLEGPRGQISDLTFIDGGQTLVSSSRGSRSSGSVRLWSQTNE